MYTPPLLEALVALCGRHVEPAPIRLQQPNSCLDMDARPLQCTFLVFEMSPFFASESPVSEVIRSCFLCAILCRAASCMLSRRCEAQAVIYITIIINEAEQDNTEEQTGL